LICWIRLKSSIALPVFKSHTVQVPSAFFPSDQRVYYPGPIFIRADKPPDVSVIIPRPVIVQAGGTQSLAGEFIVGGDGASGTTGKSVWKSRSDQGFLEASLRWPDTLFQNMSGVYNAAGRTVRT
jgi:hypothetical protein